MAILTIISLNRTYKVANQDLQKNINYAEKLFRDSLEDRLDTLKLRAKTLVDFELDTVAVNDFPASETQAILQYELIKSDLEYIALIENRTFPRLQEGSIITGGFSSLIFPSICQTPLNVNMYIIGDEPWIFAAAMVTKIKTEKPLHIVYAQKLTSDFADKLKGLTAAEYSLIYNGKKIITTQMDAYARRSVGTVLTDATLDNGETQIMGKSYSFQRSAALPNRISEDIKLEVALPDSDYKELGKNMQLDFSIFGILGLVLALITGYILSVNIARPIVELSNTTTEIASGNLNIGNNSLNRSDEIGLLSKNFNNMVNNLREEREQKEAHMKELNILFEISNAVNLFTDSEELLKFVLSHAIEILGAERGSIMLLDDKTDELVIKVATGGRFRAINSTPIKLGAGVCGKVAFSGEGMICNEGFKDSRFKNFGSIMPVEDICSLICAPLKFKEGTIGVINIVNKKDGKLFNENDLSLLNLIGSQAAVTIENNKLYELSITDGMTHLFIHRYFQARLSEELLRARRYGLNVSLIMIDIDNFKKFNDTYGHQIGDQVIQKVAASIKDSVRIGIDIPCRYGGEEMCIILPETKAEDAFLTAERVRNNISAFGLPYETGELHVTVSIGVATYPAHCSDKESLIKASDAAMYASKKSGKNKTTIYS